MHREQKRERHGVVFCQIVGLQKRFETASSKRFGAVVKITLAFLLGQILQKVTINHTIFWREKFNFAKIVFTDDSQWTKTVFQFLQFFSLEKFIVISTILSPLLLLHFGIAVVFLFFPNSFSSSSNDIAKGGFMNLHCSEKPREDQSHLFFTNTFQCIF